MVDVFVILQKMSSFLFFLTVYLDENVHTYKYTNFQDKYDHVSNTHNFLWWMTWLSRAEVALLSPSELFHLRFLQKEDLCDVTAFLRILVCWESYKEAYHLQRSGHNR